METSKEEKPADDETSAIERLMKKCLMGQLPRKKIKAEDLKDLDKNPSSVTYSSGQDCITESWSGWKGPLESNLPIKQGHLERVAPNCV